MLLNKNMVHGFHEPVMYKSNLPFRPDLLHIAGMGPGSYSSALGITLSPQHHESASTAPDGSQPTSRPSRVGGASGVGGGAPGGAGGAHQLPLGSDVLDATSQEIKLEKSNILLLGPTGSGTRWVISIADRVWFTSNSKDYAC
jgi:hypothetical protein